MASALVGTERRLPKFITAWQCVACGFGGGGVRWRDHITHSTGNRPKINTTAPGVEAGARQRDRGTSILDSNSTSMMVQLCHHKHSYPHPSVVLKSTMHPLAVGPIGTRGMINARAGAGAGAGADGHGHGDAALPAHGPSADDGHSANHLLCICILMVAMITLMTQRTPRCPYTGLCILATNTLELHVHPKILRPSCCTAYALLCAVPAE